MPLPASLTTVTLRGTFFESNGSPATGTIVIFSTEHLVSSTDDAIVGPLNFEVALDVNGFFEVTVPATNDPQWGPANFTYTVKESLSTGVRTYRIAVPYDTAGGTLDLADVSPVQNAPAPAMYVLVSTANVNGGYPRIDPTTGKIPSSVIPAGGGNADGSFKGTWSGATAYIAGDVVIRSGGTYGAIQASTNQDPVTQTAFWTQLPTSAGAVSSVFGRTGAVVAAANDYAVADVSGLTAALSAKADLVGGVIPDAQIPAIAITDYLGSVANQATMLALSGQKGDWAIRSDLGSVWIITGTDPTLLASWTQLSYPTAPVTSVAGRTGAVTLTKSDVGLSNVDNTADSAKTFTESQITNLTTDLAAKAPLAAPAFTGAATAVDLVVSGKLAISPDTLTDAATIAVDASLGNHFRVTLGGNRILGNPTNLVDNQHLTFELIQDAVGSRTIALDTKYVLGTDISSVVLTTTPNKRDFLGAIYNAATDKLYVVSLVKGY